MCTILRPSPSAMSKTPPTSTPKKFPRYVAGSNCDNCLQLQGKPGNNYRPCSLFPGKFVAVSGWCSGWTAEM